MSGTSGDAPRGTETRCPPAYTWVPGRVCALSSKGAFVSPSTLHYRSLRPRPVPCTHDIPDIEYTGDEVVRCTRLAGDVTYVHARDGTLYVGQITNGPDAKGVTIFDWAGDRDTAYPIIGIGVIAGVASPYDESDVLYAVMQEDARCELYTVARGVGLYPHWQPESVKEVITAMASTADRVYIALQRTDKMESGPKEGLGVQQIVVVLGADGRVLARHELPNVATGNKRTAAYYSASACGNYAVLSNGMFMVFVDDAGVAASRIDTPLECVTALPERRVAAMRQDGAVVLFKPTIDDREPEGHTIVWLTALRWQAMPLSLEYVRRVDPLVGEHGRPFPPHDRMPEIERRPRLLYDDTTGILYVGTMHGYVYRVPVTAKAVAALDETQWPLVRRGDLTDAFADIARDELARLYVVMCRVRSRSRRAAARCCGRSGRAHTTTAYAPRRFSFCTARSPSMRPSVSGCTGTATPRRRPSSATCARWSLSAAARAACPSTSPRCRCRPSSGVARAVLEPTPTTTHRAFADCWPTNGGFPTTGTSWAPSRCRPPPRCSWPARSWPRCTCASPSPTAALSCACAR